MRSPPQPSSFNPSDVTAPPGSSLFTTPCRPRSPKRLGPEGRQCQQAYGCTNGRPQCRKTRGVTERNHNAQGSEAARHTRTTHRVERIAWHAELRAHDASAKEGNRDKTVMCAQRLACEAVAAKHYNIRRLLEAQCAKQHTPRLTPTMRKRSRGAPGKDRGNVSDGARPATAAPPRPGRSRTRGGRCEEAASLHGPGPPSHG